MLNTK